MGNECCPPSSMNNRTDSENVQNNVQSTQEEVCEVDNPEEYDKIAVDILRRELSNDPETFILNQLLMSYMFFDDYSEEIRVLAHTTPGKAQKMNSKLVENYQKQFFMPDTVLESVNKRVKFEYADGSKRGKIEALSSLRVFIIHDNIEIIDNTAGYSSIDKPSYKVTIEESKNTGFLKALVIDSPIDPINGKRLSADSVYSTNSNKVPKKSISPPNRMYNLDEPSTSQAQDSRTDSGLGTDTDYAYSRITAAQSLENIYVIEKDIYTNIHQFPTQCITSIKQKNDNLSDSDSDDDDEDIKSKKKRTTSKSDLFLHKHYFNSIEFMNHFKNNVFPNYLGQVLEFSTDCIQNAKSIPGSIFCDSVDNNACFLLDEVNDTSTQYEVIPAISIPWPDIIAFEWPLRRRPTVLDNTEIRPVRYEWPTRKMINEIKQLHCTITPKGFMPKKGENSEMYLEWEVGFPKVERFLEFRMSHAQMRVFLYIMLLHKKFIEPKTHKHGLLIQHIRTLMFWECETNYKDWLEDKLGSKLKALLRKLYAHMSKGQLSNYFIKNKNEFRNVPRMYLIPNQEFIHKFLETPLPFLFSALKDLRYTSEKFYPEPNLEELRSIIKQDKALGALAFMSAKKSEGMRQTTKSDDKKRLNKEEKWNKKYLELKKQGKIKKGVNKLDFDDQNKNLTEEYHDPFSSIDLDIKIKKKDFKDDTYKQILVITFFIKHFMKIAKKSFKLSTPTQTMFYLKQAGYLVILLKDIHSEIENAKAFQAQIKLEEENCMRKMSIEPLELIVPSTPKRNANHQFSFHPEILDVKGKEINMVNLNKIYNADVTDKESKVSTKSMSGVKKKIKSKPFVGNGDIGSHVKLVAADIHDNKDEDFFQLQNVNKSVKFQDGSSDSVESVTVNDAEHIVL